jgi:hypothetical protein
MKVLGYDWNRRLFGDCCFLLSSLRHQTPQLTMSRFLSQSTDISTPGPETEVDHHGIPVYQSVVVRCGTTQLWKVEEHKHAVDFLKLHLTVRLFQLSFD